MKRSLLWLLLLGLYGLVAPATAFASPQEDDESDENDDIVVVKAGRVITVSGDELEDGIIVIRNGKIEVVGVSVDYPFGGKVIDARHLTVMPGMINPATRVNSLPNRNGVKPDSKLSDDFFLTAREYEDIVGVGYTTVGVAPAGATFPGRFMILRTAEVEEGKGLIITDEGPIQISFNNPATDRGAATRAFKRAESEREKQKKAREAWEKKQKNKSKSGDKKKDDKKKDDEKDPDPKPKPKPEPKPDPKPDPKPEPEPKSEETAASAADDKKDGKKTDDGFTPPPINETYKPLVSLLDKEDGYSAMVEFGRNVPSFWSSAPTGSSSYLHWVKVIEEYDFPHTYRIFNRVVRANSPFFVTPETDVEMVSKELGKREAHIALFPVINHHAYTRNRYNLGLQLMRAGCKVVYMPESDNWSFYSRMREDLAHMVRTGYPKSEILKTVTLHPAQMLGLADRLGTIEKDKDANLVFLSGDPLEFGSTVEMVMIEGKQVPIKKRLR